MVPVPQVYELTSSRGDLTRTPGIHKIKGQVNLGEDNPGDDTLRDGAEHGLYHEQDECVGTPSRYRPRPVADCVLGLDRKQECRPEVGDPVDTALSVLVGPVYEVYDPPDERKEHPGSYERHQVDDDTVPVCVCTDTR